MNKRTKSTFIFTKQFFERIFSSHPEEAEDLLLLKNSNLYIYEGISSIVSLTVTESFIALMLLNKEGKLDQNLLMSYENEAIEWGKELFMYYMALSKKISQKKTDYLIFENGSNLEKHLICEKSSI